MSFNLAAYLQKNAERTPEKLALVVPIMDGYRCLSEERVTFAALSQKVSDYQQGWHRLGLKKGDRVIVLFKPCVDLYAMVISLIALGMVPVFIDVGMPKKKVLMALQDSRAKAIITLKSLVRLFWIIPPMWRMKRFAIDGVGFGYRHASVLSKRAAEQLFSIVDVSPDDHGLISFTSGSTGRPKGADRTQGSLDSQHRILRAHLPDRENDIDMTSFPVWVLHNLCCGMTTVLPKTDLTRPGDIDAAQVLEQIQQEGVTRVSAAPASMEKLTLHMEEARCSLENVNLVFTGGATVPVSLAERMTRVFPNALCKVVYGSTEAEPISSITAAEFVADAEQHDGYLVGKPVQNVEVCVADLEDKPVSEQEVELNRCADGTIGEILVSGEHVLKAYVDNVQATNENKVKRANNTVWHRTGDTGFFDADGRIWLTGRVKDVISVNGINIQPFPLEKKIDEMSGVARSALIQAEGTIILFVAPGIPAEPDFFGELTNLFRAVGLPQVKLVEADRIPVDARHNSKIDRPLLRNMIAEGDIDIRGVIS